MPRLKTQLQQESDPVSLIGEDATPDLPVRSEDVVITDARIRTPEPDAPKPVVTVDNDGITTIK